MVTTEYKIAYSEILEILKHISKKEQEKIPSNMIKMFKANASENSNFAYNPKKTLQEQNVSEIAISIIAILYRDYWATKEQRHKLLNYQNREREKYKAEKYDVNNIFKKKNEIKPTIANAEKYPVVVKKQNFIQRIIGKIKKLIINN